MVRVHRNVYNEAGDVLEDGQVVETCGSVNLAEQYVDGFLAALEWQGFEPVEGSETNTWIGYSEMWFDGEERVQVNFVLSERNNGRPV